MNPFLLIDGNECVDYCGFNDIMEDLCLLSYDSEDRIDIILNNTLRFIQNNDFPKEKINMGEAIVFTENNVKFNISKINHIELRRLDSSDTNSNELVQNSLYDLYSTDIIDEQKNFYLLTIEIEQEGSPNSKKVYEVYSPSENSTNLTRFNLNKFDNNSFSYLKTNISKCALYSIESIIKDACLSCENDFGFYPIYDSNNDIFIQCFDSLEGYYLDIKEKAFKKCYQSCKICDKSGIEESHNCLECLGDYKYEEKIGSYKNCYENNIIDTTIVIIESTIEDIINCPNNRKIIRDKKECIEDCSKDEIYKYEFHNGCYEICPENTLISDTNPYLCELKCPKEKPYEHMLTNNCIKDCSAKEMFQEICKTNYKEENEEKHEDVSKKIIDEILSGELSELLEKVMANNTDFTFKDDYATHQISSLNFQKGNKNLSSVDFGECEGYLRTKYGIKDEEFIIYKIEHKVDGFNIPIIDYVLFTQNGSINLDLSICDNVTVQIDIPVSINEDDFDRYDPSSDFYNDICKKVSSDGKVDMTLFERTDYYNKYNMSLCEAKCVLVGYNSTTAKAICDCHIKSDMTYSNGDINPNDLLNKIESEQSISNLALTKCLNTFSNPEELKSNSGFFTILIILFAFVIVFIIFCIKGKNQLENKIDDVIYNKFDKIPQKNKMQNIVSNSKIEKDGNILGYNNVNNNIKDNKNNTRIKGKSKKKFKKKGKKKITENNKEPTIIIDNDNSNNIIGLKNSKLPCKKQEISAINNQKEIVDFPDKENDYEMNNLAYNEALKFDKRTGCDYYTSLIKNKQLFAFTFCNFNDYNSGVLKKFMLFLSFALHYTINALFFTDANMHQIFLDGGDYNFTFQFPKIIISAICATAILRIMLHTLVLTDKSILKVKQQTTKDLAYNMKKQVLKCMNIKFTIFFILNFILLILFGFYLTCFNAKYENTQIYLIENTFISFGFSMAYPFIINILPTCLRISSLDNKDNNKSCLYTTSQILQLL